MKNMTEIIESIKNFKSQNGEPEKIVLSEEFYKKLVAENEEVLGKQEKYTTICGVMLEVSPDTSIDYQIVK